jgi:cytidyltransferase-like protein
MVGVILFRAQPFHYGHLNMVKKAFQDCEENDCDLYIFVGSADKYGTKRNPLPIDFRLMLIDGTLHEVFSTNELKRIHVYPLDDMTDESDNSHGWGRYLYIKMFSKTKDSDMTIYYSDDPRIMLGWFAQDERWLLRFKFLDRYEGISATLVRNLFLEGNDDNVREVVPCFVYNYRDEIRQYLQEAK